MRTFASISLALLLTGILSGCLVNESTYLKKVSEFDALTQEQAELQTLKNDLIVKNAKLKAELAKLESDHETLKEVKSQLDETVITLLKYRTDLEKDLTSSKGEAQQRIAELRHKIGAMEAENGHLRQEIVDLKKAKMAVQNTSKTCEQLLDKMKSEIAQGQVTVSELKGRLTINIVDSILFDSGRAEVKTHGLAVLQKVVDILQAVKDKTVRIEGHTDNTPIRGALINKYGSNWELSAARAVNVTRFLQEKGLEPDLLMAAAFGEYRPVASNDTAEGKAMNRRIEIILVPKE